MQTGKPNVRARWVAKECKTHTWPETYPSTPPLEALKGSAVRGCHRQNVKGKSLHLSTYGGRYCYATSRRRVFVELPPEDY